MAKHSKETYQRMFDALLTQELGFMSTSATETNIKRAMKLVLGTCIHRGLIKSYSFLVLDENLNVHFTIVDPDNDTFDLILLYGE